jgi:3-oxoacyl-[acyl-carrier-protein] synthase II
MRRVVVTGLGAVSPHGIGVKAFWSGLAAGACAIRPLTVIESEGFRCRIAGEVPEAVAGSARRTRADRFAIAATGEALEDAGLGAAERADAALVVGAVGGGMLEAEAWYWAATRGRRSVSLPAVRSVLPCAHADVLAARWGLRGPRHTVVTACSSGAVAVAEAAALIADGVVDVAVAGGVDAITRICFMGFNALKLLDPAPCRPFDRARRGMSIGEGAVLLSSTKSMIGHTMAAAGSLEAIATVLSLTHGIVPPTANLETPDPEVRFDCVPRVPREALLDCAISNSFGFGGQNVTLLFRRR